MGVMAIAISMMLYLGNEKLTLIEKELQGIVEDFHVALGCEYKRGVLRYIITLQNCQELINNEMGMVEILSSSVKS